MIGKGGTRLGGAGFVNAKTPGGAEVAIVDDNNDSFREINKTARFGLGASAVKSVVGNVAGSYTAVKKTSVAAATEKEAIQAATENQRLLIDLEKFKASLPPE